MMFDLGKIFALPDALLKSKNYSLRMFCHSPSLLETMIQLILPPPKRRIFEQFLKFPKFIPIFFSLFQGPRKCDIDLILERHSQCWKFAENICNRISQLPISCRLYGDPSYVGPIEKLSQILFVEENRHKNFFLALFLILNSLLYGSLLILMVQFLNRSSILIIITL